MASKRGKVVIEFATLEDLERIYRLVTEPPHPTERPPPDEPAAVTAGLSYRRSDPERASRRATVGPR